MSFTIVSAGSAIAICVAMLALLRAGRWWGMRQRARVPGLSTGLGAIDGALLGLLSLVLAFTFSSSANRFDSRRNLIIQETNAIGTSYLRVDLLPAAAQPAIRADYRRYVDARLAAYAALPDVRAAFREVERAKEALQSIWTRSVAALQDPEAARALMLVLNALNAMIDAATTQVMASRLHPPPIIYWMLVALALISALVIGKATAAIPVGWRLHGIAFAALFAITFFVVLELEYPRLGFIRVDEFDRELIELRQSMG